MTDTTTNEATTDITSNSEPSPTEKLMEAVGETVDQDAPITLSKDDALTIRAAQKATAAQHARMGALREQFLADEMTVLNNIQKAHQSFDSVIKVLSEKHGVDITSGNWMLSLENMTFSKLPDQK